MLVGLVFGAAGFAGFAPAGAVAGKLPDGYLPEAESRQILDKTLEITLDPDLSGLTAGERRAVEKLLEVGGIFQRIYEESRHYQSISAREELVQLDRRLGSPQATRNLLDLYDLFRGPVGRMLDNVTRPFLPVDKRPPGKNVYPWGIDKEEIEAYLERYPGARSWLLGVRSVVRRSDRPVVENDLAVLSEYPALDVLHPGLRQTLEDLVESPGDRVLYALPYSVAYAEPLMAAYQLIHEAADAVQDEDGEFASYLRNRARDLLSDDYESGDASWVTGHFKNLNAEIGSYEEYDDELYGAKSFFALSLLLRDREESEILSRAITGLQTYENSLPYEPAGYGGTGNKKTVREDIPVGVYNIIADFGQARGTNTATILPNEPEYARKYGRTILMRYNILKNPELFEARLKLFKAAVAPEYVADLSPDGGYYRTLWHEIGHYLGPDRTRDGRDLGEALEAAANKLEELKADLVSLFLTKALRERGHYTEAQQRSVYASGVRRVLLRNKPRSTQTYQVMELMQMNYYLEHGLLEFDPKRGCLLIHYDKYHSVVKRMLEEVLALQYEGDKAAAENFINKYSAWEDSVHEVLGASMLETEDYRYVLVRYGVLEN